MPTGEKKFPPGSALGQARRRCPKQATAKPSSVAAHAAWAPQPGSVIGRAGRFSGAGEDNRDYPTLPLPAAKRVSKFGTASRFDKPRASPSGTYLSPYAAQQEREKTRNSKTAAFKPVQEPSTTGLNNVPYYDTPEQFNSRTGIVMGSEAARPAPQHREEPGPGAYDPDNKENKTESAVPGYTATRFPADGDKPDGTYIDPYAAQQEREKDKDTKSAAFKPVQEPSTTGLNNVPYYDTPEQFNSRTGIVMGSEAARPAPQHREEPGPGAYDPDNKENKTESAVPGYTATRFPADGDKPDGTYIDPYAAQQEREKDKDTKSAAFKPVQEPSTTGLNNVPYYDTPEQFNSRTGIVMGSEAARPAPQHREEPGPGAYDPDNKENKTESAVPGYTATRFPADGDKPDGTYIDPYAAQQEREKDKDTKSAAFKPVQEPSTTGLNNVPYYDTPEQFNSRTGIVMGSEAARPAPQHREEPGPGAYDPDNKENKTESAVPGYTATRFPADGDKPDGTYIDPYAAQQEREKDKDTKSAAFKPVQEPSTTGLNNVPYYDTPEQFNSRTGIVMGSEAARPAPQHREEPGPGAYDPDNKENKTESAVPGYTATRFPADGDKPDGTYIDPYAAQQEREKDKDTKSAAFKPVQEPSTTGLNNVPYYDTPEQFNSRTGIVMGSEAARPAPQHREEPGPGAYDPDNKENKTESAVPGYTATRFPADGDKPDGTYIDPYAAQQEREKDKDTKSAAFKPVQEPSTTGLNNVPYYDTPEQFNSRTGIVMGSEAARPAPQHREEPGPGAYDPDNKENKTESAVPGYTATRFPADGDKPDGTYIDPYAAQQEREKDKDTKSAAFKPVQEPSTTGLNNVPYYDTPEQFNSRTGIVMGSEAARPAPQHREEPGPGAYDPDNKENKTESAVPGYTATRFPADGDKPDGTYIDPYAAQQEREKDKDTKSAAFKPVQEPSTTGLNNVPYYDTPEQFNSRTGIVMGSEAARPAPQHREEPGPGAYDPDNKENKTESAVPGYTATRFPADGDKPDGTYIDPYAAQQEREKDKDTKSAAFKPVQEPSTTGLNNVPYYDTPEQFNSRTGIVMGSEAARPSEQHREEPGPGEYDVDCVLLDGIAVNAAPGFESKSKRFPDGRGDGHPITYLDSVVTVPQTAGPQWMFAGSARPPLSKSETTSVPYYDLPSSSTGGARFGKDGRFKYENADGPAPCDYAPTQTEQPSGVASLKFSEKRFKDGKDETPGPYDIKGMHHMFCLSHSLNCRNRFGRRRGPEVAARGCAWFRVCFDEPAFCGG